MPKIYKLYQLKKGDHFRHINMETGEPEGPVYIKGRPHTDTSFGRRQQYVTFISKPGEPCDNTSTGYVDCDAEVFKVD